MKNENQKEDEEIAEEKKFQLSRKQIDLINEIVNLKIRLQYAQFELESSHLDAGTKIKLSDFIDIYN